jgi:hypothetical protein
MNESIVSTRTWRITLVALIATIAIPILIAIWIAAQGSATAQNELWRGFDDRWSINSGSIVDDQWQVQLIANSIGLALHPVDLSAFTFQARVSTSDPNLATGLIINAQDTNNFTAFLISGDGYISLREKRLGQWIDRAAWRTWPHVRLDGQSNGLRVECDPNRCIFFVNDEVTLQVNSSASSINVGLLAYPIGFSDQPAVVVFDQLSAARAFDP